MSNILAINTAQRFAQYDTISPRRCIANISILANIGFGTVSAPFSALFLPNSTHLTWVEWFLHDDFCHVASKHDVNCRLCRYWHSCEKNAIEVTQMSTLGVANRLKCAQMQPNLPYPNISIILPILPIFEPWDYWQYQYELTKRHINTNMTLLCTDSNPYLHHSVMPNMHERDKVFTL